MVKNLLPSTGDARDAVLISGLGRSPGVENSTLLPSILAWKIPWAEEPGLQSMGLQRVGHR